MLTSFSRAYEALPYCSTSVHLSPTVYSCTCITTQHIYQNKEHSQIMTGEKSGPDFKSKNNLIVVVYLLKANNWYLLRLFKLFIMILTFIFKNKITPTTKKKSDHPLVGWGHFYTKDKRMIGL